MPNYIYDPERDGITVALLSRFRDCRESAELYAQGWAQRGTSLAMTYGSISHGVLELVYRDIQLKKLRKLPSLQETKKYIRKVEVLWEKDNPKADVKTLEFKEFSFLLAEATLPVYFEYWFKDIKEMTWLALEQVFKVPYKLSQFGFKDTYLYGKMDGVFKSNGIWLLETKTKGRIDEGSLVDTLPLNFQNNFYLSALRRMHKVKPSGVKYNIIRRTGFEQKKKESIVQFAKRCAADVRARPEFYFIRYEIGIDKAELDAFDIELENQIVEFMQWWTGKLKHYRNPNQCETKYGRCWALGICSNGNMKQYEKRKEVFRELEEI